MTLMLNALQALSLATLFVAAPMEIIPLLDRNARLDLVDYFEAGQTARVENRLGGNTEMTVLSDTLLALRMTEVSTIELRLTSDSTIELSHIYTLPERTITTRRCFTTEWEGI